MANWWDKAVTGFNSKDGANALIGLGTGLLSQNTFSKGLAAGGQGFMQGAELDQQYADEATKKADALKGRNSTIEYLRSKGYDDLLAAVESGGMDMGTAWNAAIERGKPVAADPFTLGAGETRYGPNGEIIAEGAPDTKNAFSNEKDLYAQYSAADPVKAYETVKGGYERVRQSAALQTGAGDMGLIYGYMKMLDPGSVVRESEFAQAAQAGSYGQQIQGMVQRVLDGQRLPEEVRQQFVQSADGIYQETAANLGDINDQFNQRAQTYQVDPSSFIRQPEQYQPIGSNWTDAGGGFRIREK